MRRVWPDMLSVLPAQKRGATGEIQTPDTVRNGDYDLICIGSPTWWQTVSMPMRSFLKSGEARKLLSGKPFAVFVVCRQYWLENLTAVRELAEEQGGRLRGRNPFHVSGRPVRSMLSLTSYLGAGSTARSTWACVSRRPTCSRNNWSRRESSPLASRIGCSASRGSCPCPHIRRVVRIAGHASNKSIRRSAHEDYWLARLAAFGGAKTLDSLVVDSDGTVTVTVTEDLRRGGLPRMLATLYRGDLNIVSTEKWRPAEDSRLSGEISVAVNGAPGSGHGAAVLTPSGDGSRLNLVCDGGVQRPVGRRQDRELRRGPVRRWLR